MATPKSYDVYCCYASQDLMHIEHCINEIQSWIIDQRPISYFWDQKSILASEDWKKALDNAIQSSRYFIVFFTQNWKESEWLMYEIAQIINLKNSDPDGIKIFPLLYPEVKPSHIIEMERIQFQKIKREKEEIFILHQIGKQIGAKFANKPDLDRNIYIKENAGVFYETVSDKIVFSSNSAAKLRELVIVHNLEEDISDLDENNFYILLDWLRYLRYIGSWKDAIAIMEKAINNNKLAKNSTTKFWLEFEYFILRYEYRADFRSSLKTNKLFGISTNDFDKKNKNKIKIFVKHIFDQIQSSKFDDTFESTWLRTIASKALGNIYKELKLDEDNIDVARKYCNYALSQARLIEEKHSDRLSPNCIRLLLFDCYRELANVEIYKKNFKEAVNLFDKALEEILALKHQSAPEDLMKNLQGLLYYFWGGFLVTCGLYSPLAVNLLENSLRIFEADGAPKNQVRIAANYTLLGRLIPALKKSRKVEKNPYFELIEKIEELKNIISDSSEISSGLLRYSNSELFREGKENIEKARSICIKIGHTYTMLRTTLTFLEILINEIISEKDDRKVIHRISEAQRVYTETAEVGGFQLAPDFSIEEIEERLNIIYELGIHSCSRLRYPHLRKLLKKDFNFISPPPKIKSK